MTTTIENQQLKEMIGKVIEGDQTPADLLAWANDIETEFVIQITHMVGEGSDALADECRKFLKLIDFLEDNDIEKVKKALVVAEYVGSSNLC